MADIGQIKTAAGLGTETTELLAERSDTLADHERMHTGTSRATALISQAVHIYIRKLPHVVADRRGQLVTRLQRNLGYHARRFSTENMCVQIRGCIGRSCTRIRITERIRHGAIERYRRLVTGSRIAADQGCHVVDGKDRGGTCEQGDGECSTQAAN